MELIPLHSHQKEKQKQTEHPRVFKLFHYHNNIVKWEKSLITQIFISPWLYKHLDEYLGALYCVRII